MKHEQNIDCGGGYVKLFPNSLDQTDMHGDSEYNIMFGEGLLPGADLCPISWRETQTPLTFLIVMIVFGRGAKRIKSQQQFIAL